jgi:shikimate dehydrogenase
LKLRYRLVSRVRGPETLTYKDITPNIIENTLLIINTTPLGMFPDTDGKPDIRYDLIGQKHVMFDLVYNPEITVFLKMGQERGCTIISGLKMLYSQAEKAWEIWNNDDY